MEHIATQTLESETITYLDHESMWGEVGDGTDDIEVIDVVESDGLMTEQLFRKLYNPNMPKAGNKNPKTGKYALYNMPQSQALTKELIQVTEDRAMNYFTEDFDNPDAEFALGQIFDFGGKFATIENPLLPMFSTCAINPKTGKAHLGWFINGVATTSQAKRFLKDIREGFKEILADYNERHGVADDRGYTFFTTRNILNPANEAIWGTSELLDMKTAWGYIQRWRAAKLAADINGVDDNGELVAPKQGRNSHLFKVLTAEAPKLRDTNKSEEDFTRAVYNLALTVDLNFENPLSVEDVAEFNDLVKRVTKFTAEHHDKELLTYAVSAFKKSLTDDEFKAQVHEQAKANDEAGVRKYSDKRANQIIEWVLAHRDRDDAAESKKQAARSAMRAVVKELPNKHNALLSLVDAGLTNKEISEQLGRSTSWVSTNKSRAITWRDKQSQQVS